MACGADLEAKQLMDELTDGIEFEIPNINISDPEYDFPLDRFTDMYAIQTKLTNEMLTEKRFDGNGTFDVIMAGYSAHLEKEYKASRITGAEYAKTFVALTESAMGGAIQFLLGRDQAFWAAQMAQIQAITGRVQLEVVKAQLVESQFRALNTKAEYALTSMKLASESIQYCTAKYNLDFTAPAQLLLLGAQLSMVKEQAEAQRAQTSNTRLDGVTPVLGSLGKQRDLYDQQITSYKRDAEMKAAKLFTDAWMTMKAIDEGLAPPTGFSNTSLDIVLSTVKTNNAL